MKYYFVKLSTPLSINLDNIKETPNTTIFGFLAPYSDDYDKHEKIIDDIWDYTGYLAAMHEWSAGAEDFTLTENGNDWVDRNGFVHRTDEWVLDICSRSRRKLELIYTLHIVDTDYLDEDFLASGKIGGLIISETLSNVLIDIEESQEQTIYLFNRPLFLPKNHIWKGEDGYVNIYGLAVDRENTSKLLEETNNYLGFLAQCEEVIMNGVSTPGYRVIWSADKMIWEKDGKIYSPRDEEFLEDGLRSKDKLGLNVVAVISPSIKLIDGVRSNFLISQDVYERLMRDRVKWMS